MKSTTLICIISCVVAAHTQQPLKKNLFSKDLMDLILPNMTRSNLLECYDIYIPEITRVAEDGQRQIEVCVSSADLSRQIILEKYEEDQFRVDSDVFKLQMALETCTDPEDALTYLTCINSGSSEYLFYIDSITSSSSQLLYKISSQITGIDTQESNCTQKSIDETKTKTNETLTNLQSCLGLATAIYST